MSEFFVAGIDAGQSSTTAVVGDETGHAIGRGRAGPADEIGQAADSTRLHDALRDALEAARCDAGLAPDARFVAIVAGISGYEGRIYGIKPQLPTGRLVLLHDAPIAHAGALAGEVGAVVIAGTGSAVFATGGATDRTVGGWGYLFGDEGSAFWLVRETLAASMRAEDAGRVADDQTRAACEFFAQPSLRAIARAFYAGELSRDRFASFAPIALQFESSRAIAARGAELLAGLAAAALHGEPAPRIALTGGMFDDAFVRELAGDAIRAVIPGARLVAPAYDPETGALLLAYREAGRTFAGPRRSAPA